MEAGLFSFMLIFEFLITKNGGVGLSLFRRRYRSTWKSFDYFAAAGTCATYKLVTVVYVILIVF